MDISPLVIEKIRKAVAQEYGEGIIIQDILDDFPMLDRGELLRLITLEREEMTKKNAI